MSGIPLDAKYLVGTLVVLGALCVVAALWRSQRRTILLSACLATPHSLWGLLVVPHYWAPRSVLSAGVALEDVMFNLGFGGWAWVGAALAMREQVAVSLDGRRIVRRYLLVLASCALAAALIAQLPGPARMHAILLLMAAMSVLLLAGRPELWPIAVYGALISTAGYGTMLLVTAWVWPDFLSLWRAENLLGPRLAGVPLEEFAWGALFGPCWGLGMAFVLDARVASAPARGRVAGSRSGP